MKKQDKQSAFMKVHAFIDNNAKNFIIPTIREVYYFVKENNLPLRRGETSDYLRQNFAYYAETNFNSARVKHSIRVSTSSLGSVALDLAWFGKTKAFKEYGIINPRIYCFLTGVCLLSRQVFLLPVPRGKSFKDLKGPLEKLIKAYKTAKGVSVTSLSSDRERALTSTGCHHFLRDQGIKHYTYELSSRKNSLAENANKLVRQEWSRFAKRYPGLSDIRIAAAVERNINERPLQYDNGKVSKFARKDITKRTLQKFLRDRQKKHTGHFWSHVRINPEYAKFKYKPGDRVRLFEKLAEMPNPASKRSENSLLPMLYTIVKQAAYLRDGKVCAYYLVRPENADFDDRTYVVYPETIQKVVVTNN